MFQCLAALTGLFFFQRHSLGLLFQPGRIVTLPWNSFSPVKFQYPAGHMIQEITVVSNTDYRSGILLQMLFQPIDRFIQQQYVRLLKQQAAQGNPAPLSTGKRIHHLILGGTPQRIHGPLQTTVQIPGIRSVYLILQFCLTIDKSIQFIRIFQHFRISELLIDLLKFLQSVHNILYPLLHNLLNSFAGFQLRILLQIPYGISRRKNHFTLIIFLDTGNNFQQSRFSRTVQTDNTDFRSIEKR